MELPDVATPAAQDPVIRTGATPFQRGLAPDPLECGRRSSATRAAHADQGVERTHQLEAEFADEARRAVGIGDAVHPGIAGLGRRLIGHRRKFREQAFSLEPGMGGRIQRQQNPHHFSANADLRRDAHIMRRQHIAFPGIETESLAIGIIQVQPFQVVRAEPSGPGKTGCEQAAVFHQRLRGKVDGSESRHLNIQCLLKKKPLTATSGSDTSLPISGCWNSMSAKATRPSVSR